MSLNPTTLARALTALGDPTSSMYPGNGTAADGPGRLTAAYAQYAADAVDLGGNRFLGGNQPAMRLALTTALATVAGTPSSAAQAIAAAHTAFWTGAQFVPGAPPPPGTPGTVGGDGIFSLATTSVVTAAPGAPLAVALQALFAAPSGQALSRCQAIAQAWHAVTATVLVTMAGLDTTPPPAGPLPISAVGPIR